MNCVITLKTIFNELIYILASNFESFEYPGLGAESSTHSSPATDIGVMSLTNPYYTYQYIRCKLIHIKLSVDACIKK